MLAQRDDPELFAAYREHGLGRLLKRDYDLAYASYSSVNHAEWPDVREKDTVVCREPLHGGHRVGSFTASPRTIRPEPAISAFQYARDGICAVFDHFVIDLRREFDPVEDALNRALYEPDGSQSGDSELDAEAT